MILIYKSGRVWLVSMDRKAAWVVLNMVSFLSGDKVQRMQSVFGGPEGLLRASVRDISSLLWINQEKARSILEKSKKIDYIKEFSRAKREGIEIITLDDVDYPASLRSIHSPPLVLYIKGRLLPQDRLAMAVVGTRKSTYYGNTVTEILSRDLSERGVTIVSGLASGIDTAAHRGALKGGGRTIAVLGTGVDICYPLQNRRLSKRIVGSGALVSEYPVGTPPNRYNFPRRNRIISGLSLGTIVVEAPEKSGALITADLALEQGRDVFVVPGSIFSRASRGAHNLIKQGAKLIENARDVLFEFDSLKQLISPDRLNTTVMKNKIELGKEEQRIYDILAVEPMHIDLVSARSRVSITEVTRILSVLELRGIVKQTGCNTFVALK